MSLLNDITANALDADYRRKADERAAKRAAGAGTDAIPNAAGERSRPRVRWVGSPVLAAGLLAIGLLVGVAYVRVQDNESVRSAERESLIQRIQTSRAEVEQLQDRVNTLEADIGTLESVRLESTAVGRRLADRTAVAQTHVGTGPVIGPGVIITLDDAPEDWPGRDPDDSLVKDVDIQQVVNGLWTAGAEAIAVNGQRLTPTSAIRSANNIVQVNYQPVSPPYTVSAIGDDKTLAARFGEGYGGRWLRAVSSDVGIRFSVAIANDDLVLPAGSAPLNVAAAGRAP